MDTHSLHQLFTFKSIFDGLEDAVVCHDFDLKITNWNPAAERLFGYTAADVLGMNASLMIPGDRLAELKDGLDDLLKRKRKKTFQTERITKAGALLPVLLTLSPISNEEGEVIGASQILRDNTEQQKAHHQQAVLAAIIEGSDDAIISKTLDGIIVTWNKGAEKIFGYAGEDAIGKHISLLIPEDRLDEEDRIIGEIKKGQKVEHYQTIRKRKDNSLINISLTVSPIRNYADEIVGASKIARDITGQRRSEITLSQNAEKLALLNRIGKSISEQLDINVVLQKVTDATTELTGASFGAFFYNKVNAEGESYMLYTLSGVPREAFASFPMPRNTAVFHATFSGEGVVRVDDITKDPRYGKNDPHFGMPKGHLPVVSYLAVPVISSSGAVIGGLFFGHPEPGMFLEEHEDIVVNVASQAAVALDNAKLLEEVTELSRKKDEFLALASHELKTPLTSMSGFLQLAARHADEGASQDFIHKSIRQLAKLNTLVGDLFDVSKLKAGKLQFHFEPVEINNLIKEVCDSITPSLRKQNIELHLDGEVTVMADKIRLEQVITNLVTNAAKYAPKSQNIIVSSVNRNNEILVSVKDYGPGISKENQTQLFNQFYRVENDDRFASGLGLGLFITREIVERHQGKIWVESEPGKGATFNFTIPLR